MDAIKISQLGTQRTRHLARHILKAEWTIGDRWIVTGGMGMHIVIAGTYGQPRTFKCDGEHCSEAKDGACSHILAVMEAM